MLRGSQLVHSDNQKELLDFDKFMVFGSWARIFRRLFLKRCTFGSKSGTKSLVRRNQAKNCSRAFEGLSYLAYTILKKFCLVIFFSHIIQLSLNSSEYLPFYLL